jgi:hypothetical protein
MEAKTTTADGKVGGRGVCTRRQEKQLEPLGRLLPDAYPSLSSLTVSFERRDCVDLSGCGLPREEKICLI